MSAVGTSVPRKEALGKLTGAAVYTDDMVLPDMLFGATVRSSISRGRILGIHFEGDLPWDEIVVVTAKDIPGKNYVKLILEDQPVLAEGVINHPEEPIVLLAHADRYLVEKARQCVRIEYEGLPPLFDLLESDKASQVIWGSDNVFKKIDIVKGDVDAAWQQPGLKIIEGEYRTGASEQLYIETNGMIAQYGDDGVTVWGSMQCPYYVHSALMPCFDLPPEKVRVVQMETGGGFGGKEEYPSIIACHAALLAMKAGKPVKIVYDREEDMVATTKRHPSYTRHRTAVTEDGKLVAMDVEFLIDGGAYATLSAVVLSRGSIHAAGPYYCPNVRVRARALATNFVPHGAYRGFGNPQCMFALERHLDQVAKAVGLTPIELRRRNFLKDGQDTATGQVKNDGVDMHDLLERTLLAADFHAKQERFRRENPTSPIKRGMGLACFFHGSGFTGGGEVRISAVAGVEATKEGKVRVLAASTEIGQGTTTVFSQIVADALGLPYDMIEVARPDTSLVPNSGPTVASRTVMVVGKLLETAAVGLKQALVQSGHLKVPFTPDEFRTACASYLERYPDLKLFSQYFVPPTVRWSDETFQGDAYAAFAWAVYIAEVSVDTRTYETKVEDFVAMQEVGKVVHPLMAAGQVEGGVAQGIGFALSEQVVWRDGRMINNQMTNYIMPTAVDLPPIRVLFHEVPYSGGPQGAKGVGELPINAPGPAIINAIEDALGISMPEIPCTPEMLMEAMLKNA